MDFLIPNLNTSIIVSCAILIVISYLLMHRRFTKMRVAPEAKGAWPIIGHLPLLGGSTPPHRALGAMANKYGPVFTIRLGTHRALVVSNFETAKECFTVNDLGVSSRPQQISFKHLGYNHAMFGLAPYGAYWREIRKTATLHLFSNRRLELLKHVWISEIAIFVKQLHRFWKDKKNVAHQALVEMKQLLGDLSMKVILRIVAGRRYSVGPGDAGGEEESRRIQRSIKGFFQLLGLFLIGDAVPCLRWMDLGGYEKSMKKTAAELDDTLDKWLQEHKRKREGGQQSEQDFMDVMLSLQDHYSDLATTFDVDTIIKSAALNIIAGGIDTTKITVTWALSLLLNNRRVLEKAKEELDSHVGRERAVGESDISELEYLEAIVKETLRLYPAAPLSGPREFTRDCDIGGYHVPKGTRLITNLWQIQTDPQVWEDPLEFKPERFLTTHKDVDYWGQQHFEYIPFGSGRRACPGSALALRVIKLTLASFLHAFEISTPSDADVDMTESFGLTNLKATPLELLIKPRLPAHLFG